MSPSTPDSDQTTLEELLKNFSLASARKKKTFIDLVESKAKEIFQLGISSLDHFDREGDDWAAGWTLQVLYAHNPKEFPRIFNTETQGWFSTYSDQNIDFFKLQENLLARRFEDADRLTSSLLRKLAGEAAESRGYIYFSEVEFIPGRDLITIDRLWTAFSQGRFGFSAQARLLKGLDGRYDRLWPRIGWKNDGVWTRYPNSFTWSLDAPEGHMPLINQLRGVRLMDSLLNHPSLVSRRSEN